MSSIVDSYSTFLAERLGEGEVLRIAQPRESTSPEASSSRSSLYKSKRDRRENRRPDEEPSRTSAMSKLWKRDETDRDIERESPVAALMISDEDSATFKSMRTPISHGAEIGVCASLKNKLYNDIAERICVRSKLTLSRCHRILVMQSELTAQASSGTQPNKGES